MKIVICYDIQWGPVCEYPFIVEVQRHYATKCDIYVTFTSAKIEKLFNFTDPCRLQNKNDGCPKVRVEKPCFHTTEVYLSDFMLKY